MPLEDTKQTEKTGEEGYVLEPAERMVFQAISQKIIQAKMKVYNLNRGREQALKEFDDLLAKGLREVDNMESQFGGALSFIAHSKGIGAASIDAEFTRISPQKG